MLSYLERKEIVPNHIIAVGYDGTVVNTGPRGGAIRFFEDKLKEPLHWFACQLHANDLPLRPLIMDGWILMEKITGPRGFV